MIRAHTFFLVPLQFYDPHVGNILLMPDNGDLLPITNLQGFPCWEGNVYDSKVSTIQNSVAIPQYSVLVKCCLDAQTIMDIKTQTTEFMSSEAYDLLVKLYPEAAEIVASEAKDNLTMNTVAELMITKMYAGRTPAEVVWLWPELEGKFCDILMP